jgi:uncharacterized protein
MSIPARKEASMQSDLELLLQLQVIDYDLGELERSKEYLPDMMENLTREMTEAQGRLEQARKALEQARIRQREIELDIASKETQLQRFQEQMMSIKTNKEYDALVAQIDATKYGISDAETHMLEVMDTLARMEQEIPELEKAAGEMVQNNDRQLKVLQEKIDAIGDKVASKLAERDRIVQAVPRQIKSMYERVRKGRGGTPVVPVRKRACSACFKALTPRKVQEIKKGDQIHTCESCGVLLYWDESISN